MKSRKSTFILLLLFFVGLSVMLYPTLADYWNTKTQTEAIINYQAMLDRIPKEDHSQLFAQAEEYNRALAQLADPMREYKQVDGYKDCLDLRDNGMMGYISIDRIGQELPIYHGTSDAVLSAAVGHIRGTSLPVGGENTHAVLSAHRGLPTAELFTHLDRLETGDTFTLTILGKVLTYQVDQIRIVEPDNTEYLGIEKGQDYCTLLTCTPYGINSQRLLVRGTRMDTVENKVIRIDNQAYRVDALIVMPIVALPMLAVLMLFVLFAPVKKVSAGEDLW